ncbi:MAG: hypothetical protein JO023_23190 [Chloroflexi bacterium]|nr:hypothetical protein [Chloroflexota bacterium]
MTYDPIAAAPRLPDVATLFVPDSWLTIRAMHRAVPPSAGHTTVVTTPDWRSNSAFIDAIAERERREFEDSLRAQTERLHRNETESRV